jgi:hypothetical protein
VTVNSSILTDCYFFFFPRLVSAVLYSTIFRISIVHNIFFNNQGIGFLFFFALRCVFFLGTSSRDHVTDRRSVTLCYRGRTEAIYAFFNCLQFGTKLLISPPFITISLYQRRFHKMHALFQVRP